MSSSKYLKVATLSWQNGLVYRTSMLLWRLRQFLTSLMALTLWSVIFQGQSEVFAYSGDQMLQYVFMTAVVQGLILATLLHGLASDIYNGSITVLLIKPINLFGYLFSIDMADKLKNVGLAVVELSLLAWLFQPSWLTPEWWQLALAGASLIMGIGLYFVILLLFGSLGFWSPDTWGPRFLFATILEIAAGKLYPLDILPQWLQTAMALTPFPYVSYVQVQMLLGRWSLWQCWQATLGVAFWLVLLSIVTAIVWRRGAKEYSAAGI